jgi:hypothetical protein
MAFYRDIKYRASDTTDIQTLDNITFDGSSSYSLTRNSAAFTPSGASNILLSIDGVVQSGNFTITGSTIDFGVNVPATSECDFILHLGVGVINTPADGSVTEAKIANGAVSLDKLSATGTKDSTTFLRGDNTFATVSTSMYPAFEAYDESSQSVSDNTYTKLDVATENFDTNNNFDNSAMRFTPTVAGKYFVYAKSDCDAGGYEDLRDTHVAFYKNGSILTYTNARFMQGNTNSNGGTVATPFTSAVITLNGSSDYVEVYVKINSQDGSNGTALNSIFGAFRIGD